MQIEDLELTVDDVTDVQWEEAAEFLGDEIPGEIVAIECTDCEVCFGACSCQQCFGLSC